MRTKRISSVPRVNGIRVTLKAGSVVFGGSALFLLVLPEIFVELLALDSASASLVWSMRMIGVTLIALAGNMWFNAINPDNQAVMRVGSVMAIAAAGLGVLTLVVPAVLTWFTVLYALVGFSFSLSYIVFLATTRR